MKTSDWIIIILLCVIVLMAFIIRDLQPIEVDGYVTINSPMGQYRLSKDSIYQEMEINDEFGTSYYIKFQSVEGTTVIEFRDTDDIPAIDNKDSFLMAFYGEGK